MTNSELGSFFFVTLYYLTFLLEEVGTIYLFALLTFLLIISLGDFTEFGPVGDYLVLKVASHFDDDNCEAVLTCGQVIPIKRRE